MDETAELGTETEATAAVSPMKRAAHAYAARLQWAVFPLAPRSKVPAIAKRDGGHGCRDATTDPERIAAWWTMLPTCNVGIATGTPSGFFVVDVDPRSGGDAALEFLETKHQTLPATVEALTGGGGRHLLFRMIPELADVTWSSLAPGIDLKGTGGYIVAAPSIHPTGTAYAWEAAHRPLEVPIADPPAWLVAQLRKRMATAPAAHPVDYWRALVTKGVDEGGRNAAVARLAGHLLRRRVDPYLTLELVTTWAATRCRPPLGAGEVARTVDSIARRELARRTAA